MNPLLYFIEPISDSPSESDRAWERATVSQPPHGLRGDAAKFGNIGDSQKLLFWLGGRIHFRSINLSNTDHASRDQVLQRYESVSGRLACHWSVTGVSDTPFGEAVEVDFFGVAMELGKTHGDFS